MRLVLVGAPGAGKGTMANLISKKFGIPHLSTGDILRNAVSKGAPLGKEAKGYMNRGELVPDPLMVEIVRGEITDSRGASGFVLDGFPRNLRQAEAFEKILIDEGISLDAVIHLRVSREVAVKRLAGRRICSDCGAIYHLTNNPPRKLGVCDKCGGRLYQREDDQEATVKNRFKVYEREARGLIDFYRQKGVLKSFRADEEAKVVFQEIERFLKSLS